MLDIKQEISGFRKEADIDFVRLWQIASDVQYQLEFEDQQSIMKYSLDIVRGLMELGVFPGGWTRVR